MLPTPVMATTAVVAALLAFLFVRFTPAPVRDDMPPRLRTSSDPMTAPHVA